MCDEKIQQLSQTRIRFLFSKFRSRSSNPEGFDSKLNWWIGAINELCIQERRYHFNISQLSKAFKSCNVIPDLDCLRLVASEMKRRDNLVTRDYFINNICANSGQSWLSWGLGSLAKPLKFGLSWFGSKEDEQEECELMDQSISYSSDLVNLEAVVSGSRELMTYVNEQQLIDKCLKYEEFEKSLVTFNIKPDQLEILLLYLTSIKQVITMEDKGTRYIKFGDDVQFSDLDVSLRSLESARELIEDDIVKIEMEIEKCMVEAKSAIRASNKIKAKSLLRRKKRLEDVLSKKEAQLDNINCLSEQLVDVQSNKAVVSAYKECADALKAAQVKHDEINFTISEMEDAFETQNDILTDLGKNITTSMIDDDELEAELKEIMQLDDNEKIKVPNMSPKENDDKIDELYKRLENLRRPMRTSSPHNEPAARKVKKVAD